MELEGIQKFIDGNFPAVLMVAAGIMSLAIVYLYRKDDESRGYKFALFIGFFMGIALMFFGATRYQGWSVFDAGLIIIAGFVLFMRPLKDLSIAMLIAVLAIVLAYSYLRGLSGNLEFLSQGWPRVVIALIAGAFVYMIFHFLESLAKLVGKLLNCWPVLALLGMLCIVEGALLLADAPTLMNIYHGWRNAAGAE